MENKDFKATQEAAWARYADLSPELYIPFIIEQIDQLIDLFIFYQASQIENLAGMKLLIERSFPDRGVAHTVAHATVPAPTDDVLVLFYQVTRPFLYTSVLFQYDLWRFFYPLQFHTPTFLLYSEYAYFRKMKRTIIITGGAGFIGSHVVREFVNKYPTYHIINLDALTYAGNLENLKDIEDKPNYTFVKADITDAKHILEVFQEYKPDGVIHLAAESHVDRSITDPSAFVMTNVIGTVNLLNAAREIWKDNYEGKRFHHVSTDEVYGTLGETGLFTEETAYDPHSPYSASKASSDHFVRAYQDTYGLPVVLTNCSNNYGPNHFPEKLIPLCIHNILNNKPLPIYGDGKFTRDWLFVIDHAKAIDLVFHQGKNGQSYNVGGFNEWQNIDLVKELCKQMDEKLGRPEGTAAQLITFVKDRPGHDLRYAIDATKINQELGYQPSVTFEQGLSITIDWFLSNQEWLDNVTSGEYQSYYIKQYN